MTAIICNPPSPSLSPSPADTVTCEGVLLARTVPEETRNGDVTVCSAWWQPTLGLIRIYPMLMAGEHRAWRRYRLELTRSDKDHRFRSFKLADGGPIERVDEHSARERLRPQLERLGRGTTVKRLNEKRESLGVVRPVPGSLSFYLEHGDPDDTHEFGRKTFPLRPRLRFRDTDGPHDLGLNEWGCYEWLRKGGDPTRLVTNLRLDDPTREQLLLVGNLRDHPTSWVVIAVIGYTATQAALFV